MQVTVQILSPHIKKIMGWNDRKTEETYLFEGDTIADLIKVIHDPEGESIYDQYMKKNSIISRTYIHLDGIIFYLSKEDLQRTLHDGGKIAILGQLACCGGG